MINLIFAHVHFLQLGPLAEIFYVWKLQWLRWCKTSMILWIILFCLTYIIPYANASVRFCFGQAVKGRKVLELAYWIFKFFWNVWANNAINVSNILNKLLLFCSRAWTRMPLRKSSTRLKWILSVVSSCFVETSWSWVLDSGQWSAMAGWVDSTQFSQHLLSYFRILIHWFLHKKLNRPHYVVKKVKRWLNVAAIVQYGGVESSKLLHFGGFSLLCLQSASLVPLNQHDCFSKVTGGTNCTMRVCLCECLYVLTVCVYRADDWCLRSSDADSHGWGGRPLRWQ